MEFAGRTLLGKYRIEGILGQGGMGSVWKGAHVVTGRKVAIKVLDERFLSNVNVVQRFGREARAASAIQHEGIVEVLDLDQTEEGLPFLVMEFLEGETLSKRIERRGKLSQDEVVRVATMLLDALEAAHAHGVVHRDLKPDNIYLVPAGRRGEIVKILDFGISSKDDEAQAKLTMTGSVLGTPHYMSPEQAMGETNLDRRVDIYGAGVVLYECLVGDVPFDAPNYNKLLRVILDEEAVPPSKRGAIVDARLEAVVLSAIAKDRDRRPQTARETLERMKTALSDETERFGPEVAARLAALEKAELDAPRAPRRSASASFARPGGSGATPLATPTPSPSSDSSPAPGAAPLASGVRSRVGSAPAMSAAAGSDLGSRHSQRPSASGGLDAPVVPVPSAPAARRGPALRLDAPVGGGGGLGGLDDLDALSAPVALELDESALERPSRADGLSSASSSGRHRAISERGLAAQAGGATLPRSTPPRTTPAAGTPSARGLGPEALGSEPGRRRAVSSGGIPAARRSHDDLPAMRGGAATAASSAGGIASAEGATGDAGGGAAPGALRGWWEGLSDDARRWIVLGTIGVVLFVGAVIVVRVVVRPGESAAAGASGAGLPATASPAGGREAPASPEWVVIDLEGVPPHTEVRLDGLPGATLPLRVRRGGQHVVELRSPGYVDQRLTFTADRNQRLRASMRPAVGTTQQAP